MAGRSSPQAGGIRCIGLSGPDGSGKSSLAGELASLLHARGVPTRVVYLYGCFICRRWAVGRKRRPDGSPGGLDRVIRQMHELADFAELMLRLLFARLSLRLAALASRSREWPVLITDRSPLDGLVKFAPPAGSLPDRLYREAAESYEAILVLDAPTEVLVMRDTDHDAGYLDMRRRAFLTSASRLQNVSSIDTAGGSPVELAVAVGARLRLPVLDRESSPADSQQSAAGAIRRSAGWLTLAAAAVGGANFAFTLILSWGLHRDQYSAFLSAQALILICSMVAAAGLPWALSRRLARHSDPSVRASAVSFTIGVSVLLGAAAAIVVAVATSTFAREPVVAAAVLAAFLVFLSNPVIGYLQGNERFGLIFLLNVTDVTVRIAAGVALAVVVGFGTAGAIGGFSAGSAVVLAVAGWRLVKEARGFNLRALRQREMWRQVIGIAAVQAGVGCLVNLDQILAAVPALGGGGHFATYQLAGVLGRIPFFISSGVIIAAFPRLARLDAVGEAGSALRDTLLRTLIPISVVVATLPPALIGVAMPSAYGSDVRSIVPYTAAAGMLGGLVNLAAMCFQAQAAFRRCASVLTGGVIASALAIAIGMQFGPSGIAIGKLTGQVVALALLVAISPWLTKRAGSLFGSLAVAGAASLPLVLLAPSLTLWTVYAVALGAFTFWFAFLRADRMPNGARRAVAGPLARAEVRR